MYTKKIDIKQKTEVKGSNMKNKGKVTIISLLVVIILVCGGYMLMRPSSSAKKVAEDKPVKTETVSSSAKKHHRDVKKDSSSDESATTDDSSVADESSTADTNANVSENTPTQNNNAPAQQVTANNSQVTNNNIQPSHRQNTRTATVRANNQRAVRHSNASRTTNAQQAVTVADGMNFSYRAAQKAGMIDSNTTAEEFYKNAKEGNNSVTYNGQTIHYAKVNGTNNYRVTK